MLERPAALAPRGAPGRFTVRTLLIAGIAACICGIRSPRAAIAARLAGTRAAELCRKVDASVFGTSEAYLSGVASQLDGRLPTPTPRC